MSNGLNFHDLPFPYVYVEAVTLFMLHRSIPAYRQDSPMQSVLIKTGAHVTWLFTHSIACNLITNAPDAKLVAPNALESTTAESCAGGYLFKAVHCKY